MERLALFLLLMVGFFGLLYTMGARRRRSWRDFARAHGLVIGGNFVVPTLEGRYRDVSIHVSLASSNKKTITVYRVTLGERVPAGFFVCKEGVLQKLGKAVGAQDITIGTPELDDALSIKGNDLVRIIRLLRVPEVGSAVLRMIAAEPGLEIGQSLVIHHSGFADPKRLQHTLDMLCTLARALEAGCRLLDREDRPASV